MRRNQLTLSSISTLSTFLLATLLSVCCSACVVVFSAESETISVELEEVLVRVRKESEVLLARHSHPSVHGVHPRAIGSGSVSIFDGVRTSEHANRNGMGGPLRA